MYAIRSYYDSSREGNYGAIFRKQADGTGQVELLVANREQALFPWALSSDGKTLVVVETANADTQADRITSYNVCYTKLLRPSAITAVERDAEALFTVHSSSHARPRVPVAMSSLRHPNAVPCGRR